MALPFLEAYGQLKSGKISWQEYIDHLLARCAGGGHEEDDIEGIHRKLRNTDPFGYSIWCWSDSLYKASDTTPLKAVFISYRDGSLNDVIEKLSALQEKYAKCIRESLALLALQERRADVLKLCLDQGGFGYSSSFEDEANRVDESKDAETFKVLEESHFRQIYPRRTPRTEANNEDDTGDADEGSDFDPSKEFDEGGKYPVDW